MGLIFGLFVVANLYIAYRTRPESVPVRRDDPAYRYRLALTPILRPVLIVVGVMLTAFAGSVAASHWDTFKMWRNSTLVRHQGPAVRQGRQLLRLRLPVVPVRHLVLVRDDRHHGARGGLRQLRLRRHPHRRPRPQAHARRAGAPLGAGRPRRAAAGGVLLPRPLRPGDRLRRSCSTASATPTPTPASPARTS